jgi:hypothetical protein
MDRDEAEDVQRKTVGGASKFFCSWIVADAVEISSVSRKDDF